MIISLKAIIDLYVLAMLIALVLGIFIGRKQNRKNTGQEPVISVSNSEKPLRDSIEYLKPICK